MGPISEKAQNLLLAAAFVKAKHSSGNQVQPQCVLAQESSAFLFLPYTLLVIGIRMIGLPPAPCALVLCRASLDMETNSKALLLQGEGGWGLKRPCVHCPTTPPFAS